MSDAINRARDIIERYLPAMPDQQAAFVTRDAARALDAAGLLVSPEHDAAVAAKALREAAEEVYGDDRAAGPYSHPLSAASWLRERADRIEREAGESDADA
jgi:hypothetical protein